MLNRIFRPILLLFVLSAMTGCNDDKLLSNLTQDQANQVLAVLQQHNIAAQKNGTLKTGYTITVTPEEATTALSLLNQYQLPRPADVQIADAFPEGALVASPNAEQARVLSLQEQRLEQSLKIISQVVNARVHLSYPPFSNETNRKHHNFSAGILISYKGDIERELFISQIKSLIKNSVDSIRYENISVVLFEASAINHSPPTTAAKSHSLFITYASLSILVLLLTMAAYFHLYIKRKTRPASHEKDSELSE